MITNMKYLSSFILLVLVLHSCEKLEVANPADPNYKLQAPVLISSVTEADTAIVLSWQNTEEYTREFLVNRKSESSAYTTIATVPKDVLGYKDTSFTLDVSYSFVVQSKVSKNLSQNSNVLAVEVILPEPSDLSLTTITDSKVQLSWTDNCNYEAGYRIERDSGVGYIQVAELVQNTATYTDSSLIVGIDYFYRVAAYTNSNASNWVVSNSINTSFPAPTDLMIIALNDASVELSWIDNCSYEVGYHIERNSGLGYASIADLAENTTTYTDSLMSINVDYSYRVAAYSNSNTSGWVVSPTINTSFPAPTNLTVDAISDTSVWLSWTDNCSFEEGFRLERDSGSGFEQIVELAPNVTTYVDNGLAYQTDYSYRIAGFTSNNISSWNSSTPVNIGFPAPTSLVATILNDSQIRLNWNDNSANETGFKVERDSGTGYEFVTEVPADEIEYIDSGLQYNTSYTYRIAGFSGNSTTDWAISSSVNIGFPRPTNLLAVASGDSLIRISWNDNSENENGYRIERNSGSGFVQIAEVVANVIEYIDTDLVYETNYTYRVAGYSDNNNSSWITSSVVTIIFPAPTNLVANALDDSQVQLTWVDNSAHEEGFRIERDDGSGFTEIGSVSSDVTEYMDTGLSYGQSYEYRVAAYTSINTSQWISITAVTEFPAPSDLIANGMSDSEIQLSWTDNTSFETGFRIERDDGSGFTEIGSVSSDVTEYMDTGLTFGQNYDYRVATYTSINTSEWSIVTAATEFPGPSGLNCSVSSDSTIELQWTDNCIFENGFTIERDDGSGFIQIAETSTDTTNFSDGGLTIGSTYQYRVRAFTLINVSEYSSTASETTSGLVDIDGNEYQTIEIGGQVWMAENLKVTNYRNGSGINYITSNSAWLNTSYGAYCYYDNDIGNSDIYGVLYNWYVVDDSRNVAPEGWHVATLTEWQELSDFIGYENNGGKLKEEGTVHWNAPNNGATNESEFTALPGGQRGWEYFNGNFMLLNETAGIWHREEYSETHGGRVLMSNTSGQMSVTTGIPKNGGSSIRCIRD